MRAERLGSYSIRERYAATPVLGRLKSTCDISVVATANVTRREPAVVVATASLFLSVQRVSLFRRDFVIIESRERL